jgi:tripartite-type tricarboxylate transporter receptor subunit TctC
MTGPFRVALVFTLLAALPAHAQPAADFFKGKTVTYIVATAAGGGYDLYGRLTADYMQKNLPGSTFVVRNMPGAGHLIGTNFIANARADGLTLGTFNTGLIYNQLVKLEGVKFDLTTMSWIGKAGTDPRTMVVAEQTPYKTLNDVRNAKDQVNWAAAGVGSASYVEQKLLIEALKLPGKIITGYNANDDRLAMRRGEIHGTVGSLSTYEPFVAENHGRFVFQIGGSSTTVPMLKDLIANESPDVKAIVALIQSQGEIARLTAGPPHIPADRLAMLRAAYKKALEDPELRTKAEKAGRPIEPAFGDDVLAMVKEALNQPPSSIKLLAAALNEGAKPQSARIDTVLIEVKDMGREIVFKGPDGGSVVAKPSGSRTQITIAGKAGKREDLKAGLACTVSYQPGGDNEPDEITCK